MGTRRILLFAGLLATVLISGKICQHFGFGQGKQHENLDPVVEEKIKEPLIQQPEKVNTLVDDSVYRWDKQLLDWVPLDEESEYDVQLVVNNETAYSVWSRADRN